ncbi:MAG TPA: HDOD domain-containing protein, partial [Negativicutes bacterium]|nr:HDOD domain-containing protein [Negativicutes bacterium]
DPTVAAAVLRVANNAFVNVKTGSLAKAITFLGLTVIKALVLSCILFEFAVIKVPPFSLRKLIRKANTANRIMTTIYAELLRKQIPDTHQTAALFNDIGLLMGMHYCPAEYARIMAGFKPGGETDFMQMERDALGMTHAEFGAYLLNLWGLPYPIVETALFHREPLNDAVMNKELVAAAHIASHYAWHAISPELAQGLVPGAFEVLGVREDDVRRLLRV